MSLSISGIQLALIAVLLGQVQTQLWPPTGGFWNPGSNDFFRRLNSGRFSDTNALGRPGTGGAGVGGFGFDTLAGANIDCSIGPDPGPCTNNQTMWYFNERLSRCLTFLYGGCLGNPNRYPSKKACIERCNPKGAPEQNPCLLPSDVGRCRGRLDRFFYNKDTGQCEIFAYSGCDGNQNNFQDITTCRQVCVPGTPQGNPNTPQGNPNDPSQGGGPQGGGPPQGGPPQQGPPQQGPPQQGPPQEQPGNGQGQPVNVCILPPDGGNCQDPRLKNRLVRFFFDPNTGVCREFTYTGCEGNPNNFLTENDCIAECDRRPPTNDNRPLGPNRPNINPNANPNFNPNRPNPDSNPNQSPNPNPNFNTNRGDGPPPAFCFVPPIRGECRNDVRRFYFDSNANDCREFTFGGCGGNNNNFERYDDCMTRCFREQSTPTATRPQDICVLPAQTGGCEERLPRYYFDPNVQHCREFIYSGCQGNPNNFENRGLCESRCGQANVPPTPSERMPTNTQTTPHPCVQPLDAGPCDGKISRYYFDAGTKQCLQFTYGGCRGNDNNFDNFEACRSWCLTVVTTTQEPTKHIPKVEEKTTTKPQLIANPCIQAMDTGPCEGNVTRYYFDLTEKKCLQFTYGGCLGNDNNFQTLAACQSWCRAARGVPPKQPTPSPTPKPTKIEVCLQPPLVGPCRGRIPRFFFDVKTGTCRTFAYGGCEGNDNNFKDVAACENRCKPTPNAPTKSKGTFGSTAPTKSEDVCRLPLDAGPCNARIARFYYDSSSRTCKPFVFGGCKGNENNFKDLSSCEVRCIPGRQQPTSPTSVNKCILPAVTGLCRARFVRYFYDHKTGTCRQFVYGGCDGNANNFMNKQECEAECKAPSAARKRNDCTSPSESGRCLAFFRRFYFDVKSQKCTSFVYGGCGGNENNYKTKEECEAACTPTQKPETVELMKCPAPAGVAACVQMCNNDSNCGKDQKCCTNGCGQLCIRA